MTDQPQCPPGGWGEGTAYETRDQYLTRPLSRAEMNDLSNDERWDRVLAHHVEATFTLMSQQSPIVFQTLVYRHQIVRFVGQSRRCRSVN